MQSMQKNGGETGTGIKAKPEMPKPAAQGGLYGVNTRIMFDTMLYAVTSSKFVAYSIDSNNILIKG